jgi:hypothetical protein
MLNEIFWELNQKTLRPIWRVLLLFSFNYLVLHFTKRLLYESTSDWAFSSSSRFLSLFVSCATAILAWKYFDLNKDNNLGLLRYFGCDFYRKGMR